MLLLVEILEQAYRQMNGIEYRGAMIQRPGCKCPRIIRNLVLMYPAGMHSEEISRLKKAAERAALLWSDFRSDPIGFKAGKFTPKAAPPQVPGLPPPPPVQPPHKDIPTPNVLQACDEGLAIQVCFLYGEVMHRYARKPMELVKAMGRTRNGKPSVRIASIDIGGGTIDLAVADYYPSKWAANPSFKYRRLFYDGISIAGDDAAKRVLERLIFPCIVRDMGLNPGGWNTLFSTHGATQDDWPVTRRRLVSMVWQPLVRACLALVEEGEDVDSTIEDLLPDKPMELINTLNQRLRSVVDQKRKGMDLETTVLKVKIRFSQQELHRVFSQSLGQALKQYTDIVAQYRCDVLVLGGRPSAQPAIRRLIVESLPTPPGNVVFLHEQEIGDWYPFVVNGRVGDAKTCGVVGAALTFMAQFGRSSFVLNKMKTLEEEQKEEEEIKQALNEDESSESEDSSAPDDGEGAESKEEPEDEVPCILGVYNPAVMMLNKEFNLFPDDKNNDSTPFPFAGNEVLIGIRRIKNSQALAQCCYRIVKARKLVERLKASPVEAQTLVVTLGRDVAPEKRQLTGKEKLTRDVLSIKSIKGKIMVRNDKGRAVAIDAEMVARALVCELQTMMETDYWTDSGCFSEVKL